MRTRRGLLRPGVDRLFGSLDSMRVVLEAKTATRCKTCSYLNPLPGLRHETECVNCANPIDVAAKIRDGREGGLKYTFGGYYDAVAESLLYEGDHDLQDARDSQGSPFALRKVGHFACRCKAPLEAPAPGAADLRCGRCGNVTPVRWPDDGTRKWDKRIAYLVGDAGDRGVALRQKLEGTVVGCGNCGAPLAPQGRQRAVVCTHCRAENFLSDKIWTKLFPNPEEHAFYLVYELDEKAQAKAIAFLMHTGHYFFDKHQKKAIAGMQHAMEDRVRAERVQRVLDYENDDERDPVPADVAHEIVSRLDLDARTIEAVDVRLTDEVRRKVASDKINPKFLKRWLHSSHSGTRAIGARLAQGDALQNCAKDDSEDVRAVIAARHDAPPEIIAALRKDPSETVREKARANESYQPGFFTKLFGA
jgi:hypothetical protein